jgi:hypothetical protein
MPVRQDRGYIDEQIVPPELRSVLYERFAVRDAGARVSHCHRLGCGVHRLTVEANGRSHSVVAKRLDQAIARRVQLVAERWLPAVGLEHAAPPLLAVAAEPGARYVWHVYEDLGDCILDECAPDVRRVAPAIDLIAQLHLRFADHALLAECRQSGGTAGMQFYRDSVRDAMRSLTALRSPAFELEPERLAICDRLLSHLNRLLEEERRRAFVMEEFGGLETLLHGDLWPKNTIVLSSPAAMRVCLIDWDRVRVGPVTYDLSAFLSRHPEAERAWILELYRQAVGRAGWQLPDSSQLDVLFTTAEYARLANCVIWPPLAAMRGDAGWEWAFETLATLDGWFDALRNHC